MYIPDLAAYQRLSKDLTSHTRQRWGLSCVVQHPGWDYVFWDLASATQLVEKVRLPACLCCPAFLALAEPAEAGSWFVTALRRAS